MAKSYWFVDEIIWAKPTGAGCGRNRRFLLDRHPIQWKATLTQKGLKGFIKSQQKTK